jgi:acetyl esterase/lipase
MNMMLEDVQLAINKLKDIATGYEIGGSDFALVGESAGAHIALLYGLRNSSDPALKTVVAFYAPTLLDNIDFKANMSGAPYNSIPVSGDFYCYKNNSTACELQQGFNANFIWTLRSLVGYNLPLTTRTPAFTDTLSPAYPNNVQNNIPVFLLHGENDDLVPSDQSDSLLLVLNTKFSTSPAAATDFVSPHKMLKYPNCGHGWNGSCNKTEIMNDVITWLSNHF